MSNLKFALLLGFSLPAMGATVGFAPKSEIAFQPIARVIFETADSYVYRLPEALDEDFEDLYWINLEDSRFDRFTLETVGQVEIVSEGRFAVMRIAPDRIEAIAALLHRERASCGQLHRLFGDEIVGNRAIPTAIPIIPVTQPIADIPALQAQASPVRIKSLVEAMSSLPTRYSKAAIAEQTDVLLLNAYGEYQRSDVTVSTFAHKKSPLQPSIVVRILGTKHPEEVVILGSHIDSIANGSAIAPGADDNASGTASNLEVFRIIMENDLHFERTVEIHGYAAEELGLIGSQDIALNYSRAKTKVIAMMQNDMNMYRESLSDTIWLITNDTSPGLTRDVATLVNQYQKVVLKSGRLDAGSSDHRAWTRQGYATVFPTENPTAYNHAIHTSRDTIANSGVFSQSAEFSKLSLAFVAHFAGLEPAIDTVPL